MTDTDRMLAWLRAILDAAERDAEAATWCEQAGSWRAAVSQYGTPARPGGPRWYVEDAMDDGVITTVDPQASDDEGVARHIARNSPAAVLRRIAADRQLLDLHALEYRERPERVLGEADDPFCAECVGERYPCETLRLLAKGWGWRGETTA